MNEDQGLTQPEPPFKTDILTRNGHYGAYVLHVGLGIAGLAFAFRYHIWLVLLVVPVAIVGVLANRRIVTAPTYLKVFQLGLVVFLGIVLELVLLGVGIGNSPLGE